MAISDAVVGSLMTIYLVVIAAIKAYGLMMGQSFTGLFVLVVSTAVVGVVLVSTLTWDVSRKATSAAVLRVDVKDNAAVAEVCRGGICWHGVAVKSPASQCMNLGFVHNAIAVPTNV
ncbi:Anion exchange protein 3 [Bienertia sinuspersici]